MSADMKATLSACIKRDKPIEIKRIAIIDKTILLVIDKCITSPVLECC